MKTLIASISIVVLSVLSTTASAATLETRAWKEQGKWHVGNPPVAMILRLQEYKL